MNSSYLNHLYMIRLVKITIFMSLIIACNAQTDIIELQSSGIDSLRSIKTIQQLSMALPTNSERLRYGPDFRDAARLVVPSVVHVVSTLQLQQPEQRIEIPEFFKDFFGERWFRDFDRQPVPSIAAGSGVIITSEGHIVTNNHVIQNAGEIEVTLNDRRSYKATVVGKDPSTDLALLKIDEKGLTFLKVGNSDEVEIGDWVLAGGNPFNLSSTITAGIISAKARNINILTDQQSIESFLQTDAVVNRGNSGGALVNSRGELIGINSAIATPTGIYAGYSFAIPVNIVTKVIDDLLNYGVVQRGFLGITIRDMNSQFAEELGIEQTTGVYVDSVYKQSAASEAGIKRKDVIIKIDDIEVASSPQLQEIVGKHRPGDKLTLTLLRKKGKKTVEAVLKNNKGTIGVVTKEEVGLLERLGLQCADLSKQERKSLRLEGGVKVISIDSGIIYEQTKMRTNFIITKVNEYSVSNTDDLINFLKDKTGGIVLEGIYSSDPNKIQYYAFVIDELN